MTYCRTFVIQFQASTIWNFLCQSDPNDTRTRVEEIYRSRTKAKSPQTNGICERFHKIVLNEFYRVALRKKRRTVRSMRCRPPWKCGSKNTMKCHRIRGAGVSEKRRCRPRLARIKSGWSRQLLRRVYRGVESAQESDLPLNFHPAAIRASAVVALRSNFGSPEVRFFRLAHGGGLIAPT